MKLFYIPQSCALAPHIVANEAGIAVEAVAVDFPTKTTAEGADFLAINPKGYVPALELENGAVLTENAAILQYLADRNPESRLAPANGTFERYRLQEAINYLATEIHQNYSPLFNPSTPADVRAQRSEYLRKCYRLLDVKLAGREHVLGDGFSVVDAYLFVLTRWAKLVELDLSEFKNVQAFQSSVGARPSVQAAMKAQGIA